MPEAVEDCVDSVLEDNSDYSVSKAYATCWSQYDDGDLKSDDTPDCDFSKAVINLAGENNLDKDASARIVAASRLADTEDDTAVKAVAHRKVTGSWGNVHPAEKTKEGREHLLDTYVSTAEKALQSFDDALEDVDGESEGATVDKADGEYPTVKFKMKSSTGIMPLFKAKNGDMVVWGPASVEVVDKEGDRIRAEALEEALPQLLRRQRLSLEHSDQLVGEILENFETDEPISVKIDGEEYTREEFPTDVLELDGMEPSLFVAGKVWDDTRQARQTQRDIENGDIDSYSISGESLVATTKYEEGDVVNDIKELDLSAVTLCEEGMNQKAKFGVVSKAKGDARADEGHNVESAQAGVSKGTRGPAGVPAEGQIRVVKNMTDDNDETPDEGASNPSDAVSLDDIRSEFKGVVDESLPDGELATKSDMVNKEDVETIVEEKSLDEDDVRSIAQEVYDKSTEEKEFSDEVLELAEETGVEPAKVADIVERGDYADDEVFEDEGEMPDDEEKEMCPECGVPFEECGCDEKADDEMPPEDEDEEVDEVPEEELEDPDDDGEQEVEIDDGSEEEKGGYTHEELESMLPEDLYDAVREHLDEPEGEGEMEMSEKDLTEALDEEEVEKMIDEQFGDEMELNSPDGPSAEVRKSWEEEDDPATDGAVGPAAQQLYD
ncbi:hypothetical protein DNAM5_111 [Haloarcula californiae tailed virus 1]|uniref:Prohead protease n=1 Tax=Haloarcula californiae tailed virus 1 TaxID=1273746 RepID=R4TAK9_9CAUD|nr:head maturation protease [Haloarcula californiae tailed virus 1]AGM11970.1 hypothetical protein DNAM5_111 [Haloarcula californiae tailed virus 1]